MTSNKVQSITHVVADECENEKFSELVFREVQRMEAKGFSVSLHYQHNSGKVSCLIVGKGVKRTITAE